MDVVTLTDHALELSLAFPARGYVAALLSKQGEYRACLVMPYRDLGSFQIAQNDNHRGTLRLI